jgi:hypothetical protein
MRQSASIHCRSIKNDYQRFAKNVSATRMVERGALPHTPRFIALVSRETVLGLSKTETVSLEQHRLPLLFENCP